MIAMIVANRNDWLWENHLSDWSGGNGSLWHWRGTSEGHEWGQQSNTIASQVQVHPSANTNTPRRTHKSIQSQNVLLWSYEITSEGQNCASTHPIAPKQLENQQVALLFHPHCTGLLVLISTTVHCVLCGAGIIHKCHLLAGRVGGAPSGAPQQDSMNFLHRPGGELSSTIAKIVSNGSLEKDVWWWWKCGRQPGCVLNRWLHPAVALPAAIIKMRLKNGSH